MRIAIVGSRTLTVSNIEKYLPEGVTEIVSGGAKGIDRAAASFARAHHIKLTEFLPDYARYGRGAPLKRNEQIANYADAGIAFWDGSSRGTKYTIDRFRALGKPMTVLVSCGVSPKMPFARGKACTEN